jgi:membrane associated rhomboid family serine protease
MTSTRRTDRRPPRLLGTSWLALGMPVGLFLGWLLQISDTAQDRQFGSFLLVLGALSVVLGIALVRRSTPLLRQVSLGASGLWLVAAAVAVVIADFPSDRLWGGGLTGLVAVVTGALALAVRPDDESATTIKRTLAV